MLEGTEHMRMTWAAWFALAAIAGVVAIVRMVGGRTGSQNVEIGSVSDQWVAEHRAGHGEDSS